MPRPLRYQGPGEVFHVTARGVRRGVVFVDELDFRLYLRLLARAVAAARWKVHAYCLMHNHVHLVIRLEEETLAAGMHRLHGTYARRFNQRHGFVGHAFEARYSSEHVATESHYFEALRYVALNPVRAGLCSDPDEWPWSSHRAVAGLTTMYAPVAVREARALFGGGRASAQRYRDFVRLGMQTAA